MALCPFAVHELLPENNSQNRITPTTVICHRAVSSAKDLYGYWNSPGIVLESHFYISEDGTIYQYMDTNVRADANVDANAFAVSIETWDGGNTPDDWGWNAKQLYSLKRLIKWVCDTHGIKKAPAQTWNGGGIGGHNWFPYPWADGPRGCPGTERNRQLREDIIPAVASGNIEEEDMTPAQDAALSELWTTLISGEKRNAKINEDLGYVMTQILERINQLEESVSVGTIDYDRLADTLLSRLDVDLVRRTSS